MIADAGKEEEKRGRRTARFTRRQSPPSFPFPLSLSSFFSLSPPLLFFLWCLVVVDVFIIDILLSIPKSLIDSSPLQLGHFLGLTSTILRVDLVAPYHPPHPPHPHIPPRIDNGFRDPPFSHLLPRFSKKCHPFGYLSAFAVGSIDFLLCGCVMAF